MVVTLLRGVSYFERYGENQKISGSNPSVDMVIVHFLLWKHGV